MQTAFFISSISIAIKPYSSFRSNQFISFPVNVDNLNRIIFFQVLTQLSDIHVHATCIEIIVINPNSLQRKVTLQNFVGMSTKQAQ